MKKLVERFLPEAERQKIESCICLAESRTRGEIMVLVEGASGHYPVADLHAATVFALPAAIALTPLLGRLFWVGPSNLWVFLGVLIPLFLIFQVAAKHLLPLKRLFLSAREMEAQVKEAAEIQFYQKGVYRTREETGVLIFVSVFERKVWVLSDRGINAKIPEGYWKDVVDLIVEGIRSGRPAESICRAVAQVSDVLAEKFPVRADDTDELKNLIVEDGQA
jgi:putative membrane protein